MEKFENIYIKDSVFLQEVDSETILLDSETEEYFSLDEIGAIFYQMLKEEPNFKKAATELAEHFKTDEKIIEMDLANFVKNLMDKKLLNV